ncbi:unnamed protein product [Meganyctiphanes norvegica]|uniref:FAS1 domain-containing protein n=1 Tax=Meganyctiphanes norvegica TaxID=48144 RepID=A0AAV2QTN4_MEGNR
MYDRGRVRMYHKALLVVVGAALGVVAQQQDPRDGRDLGEFFKGLQFGIGADTAAVFDRLADNLEFTIDQVGSRIDSSFDSLSDRIEDQVQDTLPPWMREPVRRVSGPHGEDTRVAGEFHPEQPIDAIVGDFGGPSEGVDDGLKAYFEGDNVEEDAEVAVSPGPNFSKRPVSRPNFFSHTFNPFGMRPGHPSIDIFGIMNRRQWWKGENVCVDREEIDEGRNSGENSTNSSDEGDAEMSHGNGGFLFTFGQMEVTSCSESNDKYTCTTKTSRRGINKSVKVTYRCCHGYLKEATGCTKVDLRELPDALEKVGATDFLALVKAAGLKDELTKNMTLFVPSNEALQEFTVDLESENEFSNNVDEDRNLNEVYSSRDKRNSGKLDIKAIVKAHMTPGFLYAGELRDEQIIATELEGATFRINTYSTVPPSATVNCARMTTVNQHSSNGVIHSVDRMLRPVTKTLSEIILADDRFTILRQLLIKDDMMTTLKEAGQLTVFAPTDSAFKKISPAALQSLMNGNACLKTVLKNHVLGNVICSAAVQGKARTVNILDDYLMLERDDDDKMFVGEAQIISRDIMGTNGVMHIIDAPLMPQEAKPVMDVLSANNLTRFLELVEAAGMTEEISKMADATIFVPSDEAINAMTEEELNNLMADKTALREVLQYHMSSPALGARDVENNHLVNTNAGNPLRINLYSGSPLLTGLINNRRRNGIRLTAGCSRVSIMDMRACGTVVHVIDNLLEAPKMSVLKQLEDQEDFSIFTQMIKESNISDTLSGEGPFTILAPSDHVFMALPEEELNLIKEDVEMKENLVKKHILEEHVCCSGINSNTWLFMDHKRAMDGSAIHLRRTHSGRLMAGPARITHCSAPSTNGVIHTVNHLLMDVRPESNEDTNTRQGNRPVFSAPGLEIFFGGF